MLVALKNFFQCGFVKRNHGDRFCYCVRNITHLNTIIVAFFKNKLIIKKKELDVFKQIVNKMATKQHLTKKGLDDIFLTYQNN